MVEILKENGFVAGDFPCEFVKDNWTIRLDDDIMEVFSGLEDMGVGFYWSGELSIDNLNLILEDIKLADETAE